jgi:hypothetical protein
MNIRVAEIKDIYQIQVVRNLVKENQLSDPALVPDSDVEDYITRRGKDGFARSMERLLGLPLQTWQIIIFGHCSFILILKE